MALGDRRRLNWLEANAADPPTPGRIDAILGVADLLRELVTVVGNPKATKQALDDLVAAAGTHAREADRVAAERAKLEAAQEAFDKERAELDRVLERHRNEMQAERALVEGDRKAAAAARQAAEEDRKVAGGLLNEARARLHRVEQAVAGA